MITLRFEVEVKFELDEGVSERRKELAALATVSALNSVDLASVGGEVVAVSQGDFGIVQLTERRAK